MERPLKDILDSDLVMSARDIMVLSSTGSWPGGEWPEWLRAATSDLPGVASNYRMSVATSRVMDEIMYRWLEGQE